MKYLFLLASLLLISPVQAAGLDDILTSFQNMRDPKVTPEVECDVSDPKAQFYRYSCKELFSDAAPEWVKQNDDTQFFTHPNRWPAVCGYADADYLKSKHPEDVTLKDSAQRLQKYVSSHDLCVSPKEDRSSGVYKSPSQADFLKKGIKLLNRDELVEKKAKAKQIQKRSAELCCGADKLCKDTMLKVEIDFCEDTVTDPNAPDLCTENGTMYSPDDFSAWNGRSLKKAIGKFPVTPGTLTLSPFSDEGTEAMAHEFGHACSQIRRNIAIRRGSVDEFNEFKGDECEVDANVTRTYRKLTSGAGFNEASLSCLLKWAKVADKARYEDQPCKDGCDKSQLEEAVADFYSYSTAKLSEWVPLYLPDDVCKGERESDHMLSVDTFSCALLTPSFKARMEAATKCKR